MIFLIPLVCLETDKRSEGASPTNCYGGTDARTEDSATSARVWASSAVTGRRGGVANK